MKKIFLAAAFALIVNPIFAAEAPVQHPPIDVPSGLTIQDCLEVLSGLQGLDGHWVVLNENKDAKLVSFVFENDVLRGIIQDDITALNAVQNRQQKIEQDIYKEIAGTKGVIDPGTKEVTQYNQRAFDSKQKPCTAVLRHFSIKDLKLGKNEIPGTVLGAIGKILDK